jgi:serine/threonine-protein kinase
MATVYLAQDRKHGRRVALKVLTSSRLDESANERFLREIGLTARLSHPHILPLLDSGSVLGVPYYAMPYVEGESLHDRLAREGRLPVDDAVRIALEVADALAYAHAQGVIHRDIKPANILLSGRHAVVADFGIAKAMHSIAPDSGVTQAGLIVGTLAYMSPEQAMGEPMLDARSDVFSLGAVLYEMLTGERPFHAPTPQAMLARRLSGATPSAHDAHDGVPREVDEVVQRALAISIEERFSTATEFEQALGSAFRSSGAFRTGTIRVTGLPKEIPSLAVLPFENLSGDTENEFLSDGITEEILTQLSRRRTIRVCARASSFAFRRQQTDVRLIGERLGVRHLLMGSVRRAANRLRVTAQLVDASDGFQRWSERYDRTVDDVFAIQDEIGASIAQALDVTLLGREIPMPAVDRPARLDVYDAYLRGRFLWNRRTEESTRRSIECFSHAITRDSRYANAHAGLADAWVTLAIYGSAPPDEAMNAARAAAETALSLDPGLAEARTVLGLVLAAHEWQWSAAERAFREAIALNPQYPPAFQGLASVCLTPRGDIDGAVAAMQTALALDPLSPVMRTTLSSVLLYAGRALEAIDAARQVLELDPHFAPAYFFLAQAAVDAGQTDVALSAAERAVALSGSSSESLAVLALVSAETGDATRARTTRADLEERASSRYVSPTHLALAALATGESERAVDYLEEAATVRAPDVIWTPVRPGFAPLRGQPRFEALVQRLGLAGAGSSTR